MTTRHNFLLTAFAVSMTAFMLLSTHITEAQTLKTGTFNIRNENNGDKERGNGWDTRYPWICSFIEFEDLDIFGAQEVLYGQNQDMTESLEGYGCIYAGRDNGKTKGEGSPIFYKEERLRLLESGWFWLSETPDVPSKGWDAALPRICTWGHFKDRESGRKFWFFNLHMDHIGVRARAEGARLVVQRIKEWCGKGEKVFLTGDFNVDQNNEIYTTFTESGILSDSYTVSEKKYAPCGTANSFNPNAFTESRIDHVFVSPDIRVINYGVLTETYRRMSEPDSEGYKSGAFPKEITLHQYEARTLSDHFPVIVRVVLK